MSVKARSASSLLQGSWVLLKENPEWLSFPIISTIAALIVMATFVLPAGWMSHEELQAYAKNFKHMHSAAGWFGIYFVTYFVSVFSNVALTACVLERLEGRHRPVSWGFERAMTLLPSILGWVIIAATVGTTLQILQDQAKKNFVLRILLKALGVAWTAMTYFVVPILIVEGLSPAASIKRSGQLIRERWGEAVKLSLSLGAIGVIVTIGIVFLFAFSGLMMVKSVWLGVTLIILAGFALLIYGMVMGALRTVAHAVLFQYATERPLPDVFEADLLQNAFVPK